MKNTKQFWVLIFSSLLLATLFSCGKSEKKPGPDNTVSTCPYIDTFDHSCAALLSEAANDRDLYFCVDNLDLGIANAPPGPYAIANFHKRSGLNIFLGLDHAKHREGVEKFRFCDQSCLNPFDPSQSLADGAASVGLTPNQLLEKVEKAIGEAAVLTQTPRFVPGLCN
ncbi:MAG TPA: hypothetical protein VJL87_06340 [Bdellovibrionota bacterium]|nr:hypothetical protein [Bdellovibrionota bacterium]